MKETTKIKYLLACLFFSMCYLHSRAQVPVEITAGNSSYYYQHMFSGKIIAEKPFGFFNASSILLPYDKKRGIEVMSQSYLTYEINKRWATGLGSIYAPGNRFVPSVFVWFFNKKMIYRISFLREWMFGLNPVLSYSVLWNIKEAKIRILIFMRVCSFNILLQCIGTGT